MATSKPRISVYLDPEIFVRLKLDSNRPGKTFSGIVEDALTLWYSEDREHAQNNPVLRRLDRLSRRDESHTRKLAVMSDAFALFVRYFLTVIPQVPKERRVAANDEGALRYERFIENLRIAISESPRGLLGSIEDIFSDESVYFTRGELERLHEPAPPRASKSEASDV